MNPFGVLSNMGVGQTPSYNTVSVPNGFNSEGVYEMQRQLDALGWQCLQPYYGSNYQNGGGRGLTATGRNST
jgi:hypothetical protein